MLNINLLGGVSFSAHGAIVKTDLGTAGRLLASYLFEFSGRTHRREYLADLFWSDIEPDKARSALNTAIWRIRKILEMGSQGAAKQLITIGDDVVIEPIPSIRIDTQLLESASRKILRRPQADPILEDDLRQVCSAVDAYSGPFLEGYDGEWILQERERLHCLYVRVTFELMRRAALQGFYEEALDFGRKILAIDPLRESVQRNVMLLLVLNGQRVEAIRCYERLIALLHSELNIGPMPDTKQLHSEILSGDIFARMSNYTAVSFNHMRV